MAGNSPSKKKVQTLARQLILSTQEGLRYHTELLITLNRASWHPISPLQPEVPILLQDLKLMLRHSRKPSLLPLQISVNKEVMKLKDTETVHYQIKPEFP